LPGDAISQPAGGLPRRQKTAARSDIFFLGKAVQLSLFPLDTALNNGKIISMNI